MIFNVQLPHKVAQKYYLRAINNLSLLSTHFKGHMLELLSLDEHLQPFSLLYHSRRQGRGGVREGLGCSTHFNIFFSIYGFSMRISIDRIMTSSLSLQLLKKISDYATGTTVRSAFYARKYMLRAMSNILWVILPRVNSSGCFVSIHFTFENDLNLQTLVVAEEFRQIKHWYLFHLNFSS